MLQPVSESSVKVTGVAEENVTPPLRVPKGLLPFATENEEAENVASLDTVPSLYELSLKVASWSTVPLLLYELSLKVASLDIVPLSLYELSLKAASFVTVPPILLYEVSLNVASWDTVPVSSLYEVSLKAASPFTKPSLFELLLNIQF